MIIYILYDYNSEISNNNTCREQCFICGGNLVGFH